MKNTSLLTYAFGCILAVLLALLVWGGYVVYSFKARLVQEETEMLIRQVAAQVQENNMSLNNLAGAIDDEDFEAKLAFAAGATENRGKMRQWFGEDELPVAQKIKDQRDRARQDNTTDTVVRINKDFLETQQVAPIAGAAEGIGQFDSLFRRELDEKNISLHYSIHRLSPADTAWHHRAFAHSSPGFILNFYRPHLYRVDYNIAAANMLWTLVPYSATGLLLLALLAAAYYYALRAYRTQAQAHRFKESLFSNVTHELKTPLSSLQLILETAQQNKGLPIPADHLRYATCELARMRLMVEKIIAFGKMNQAQLAMDKELLNINEVITEAIEAMHPLTDQRGAVISFAPGKEILLAGDRSLLVNTLTTLIDNALKYTQGKPLVYISAEEANGNVLISVSDNGTGIPPEFHKKIFEPFFRVPAGNIHNVKGHGLGLSFAAQAVGFHGGTIKLTRKTAGSRFIIQIPLQSL